MENKVHRPEYAVSFLLILNTLMFYIVYIVAEITPLNRALSLYVTPCRRAFITFSISILIFTAV